MEDSPFNWTVEVEASIDSSYFAGYLITQVPGGFFASMYPANKIFGAAILASAIFNMAIPGAMSVGPVSVVILKIAQGFVEVSKSLKISNFSIFIVHVMFVSSAVEVIIIQFWIHQSMEENIHIYVFLIYVFLTLWDKYENDKNKKIHIIIKKM